MTCKLEMKGKPRGNLPYPRWETREIDTGNGVKLRSVGLTKNGGEVGDEEKGKMVPVSDENTSFEKNHKNGNDPSRSVRWGMVWPLVHGLFLLQRLNRDHISLFLCLCPSPSKTKLAVHGRQ